MRAMRTTVTQLNALELDDSWPELIAHCRVKRSQFVVLPEMPFGSWLSATQDVDADAWAASVAAHDAWVARLDELGATTVVGSRPVTEDGHRFNEAFIWENGVVRASHRKTYLPDEPSFWEATWYERGPVEFDAEDTSAGSAGFQICTEMWFFDHARDYGKAGADFVVTPRATEAHTLEKWIAGGRVSAVSAGAFSVSSNHSGSYPGVAMGGAGWIMSPDGVVLATTSGEVPFVTVDLDLSQAADAKDTYPRYVDASVV